MAANERNDALEEQIGQWRNYLRRRQAIHGVDAEELEDHFRDQVAGLVDSGLSPDEAFLVAVKRVGDLDELSREFALEPGSIGGFHAAVAPSRRWSDGRPSTSRSIWCGRGRWWFSSLRFSTTTERPERRWAHHGLVEAQPAKAGLGKMLKLRSEILDRINLDSSDWCTH